MLPDGGQMSSRVRYYHHVLFVYGEVLILFLGRDINRELGLELSFFSFRVGLNDQNILFHIFNDRPTRTMPRTGHERRQTYRIPYLN